jgi:hypothetical protein
MLCHPAAARHFADGQQLKKDPVCDFQVTSRRFVLPFQGRCGKSRDGIRGQPGRLPIIISPWRTMMLDIGLEATIRP